MQIHERAMALLAHIEETIFTSESEEAFVGRFSISTVGKYYGLSEKQTEICIDYLIHNNYIRYYPDGQSQNEDSRIFELTNKGVEKVGEWFYLKK